MLQALMAGETDTKKLADLAKHRLRDKIPQLREALYGKVRDHHRWMLQLLWEQLITSEASLARLDERIEQMTRPQQPVLEQLDDGGHGGVRRRSTQKNADRRARPNRKAREERNDQFADSLCALCVLCGASRLQAA